MAEQISQWATTQDHHGLRLIPPLAPEFSLYGGEDTVRRAREWALWHRYLLADLVPACAHGLYLMRSCPRSTCKTHFRQLDHARIWIPAQPRPSFARPFILAHPYANEITKETQGYARAHGLLASPPPDRPYPEADDGWYGDGTLPIRLIVGGDWPMWPIEEAAAVLLHGEPVAWPDDESDGTGVRHDSSSC